MSLPTLTISPSAFALRHGTSPGRRASARTTTSPFDTADHGIEPVARTGSIPSRRPGSARLSVVTLNTPLDLFGLTWSESASSTRTSRSSDRRPSRRGFHDPTPANPNDSINVQTIQGGDFDTRLDWTTAVALPSLFRNTWKITPIGGRHEHRASRTVPAPHCRQQRQLGGAGKEAGLRHHVGARASTGSSIAASARISVSATVRAVAVGELVAGGVGLAGVRGSALASAGGLSQVDFPASHERQHFVAPEFRRQGQGAGRGHQHGPDSSPEPAQETILSITTSSLSYDFEQAKLPGQTGWTTSRVDQLVPERPAAGLHAVDDARSLAGTGGHRHARSFRRFSPTCRRIFRSPGTRSAPSLDSWDWCTAIP